MSYSVKYERRAKTEKEWLCETYGQQYSEQLEVWLGQLASEAAAGKSPRASDDLFDILEKGLDRAENEKGQWAYFARRWREAGILDRVRALLVAIKRRRPPWRCRGASRAIPALESRINIPTDIIYEINDVKKWLVVRMIL